MTTTSTSTSTSTSTTIDSVGTPGWQPAATPVAVALACGLALGVLTNLGQGVLPGAWNQIANSAAAWTVVAFAAGALLKRSGSPRRAAIAGLCAEAGLVVGYYGYAEFGRSGAGSLFFPLVWLAMAFVAGPLFGVAGLWWRGESPWRRVTALAALAGLFGMEGIMYAWTLHYAPQAWACLAAFLLVPLLMARSHRERGLALLAAVPCALLAHALVTIPLNSLSV
ncbi:hypothetical protein EES43_02020 [Streptomyces sp. ADI96-02]|uniref:DUF6518 family protein n=1 Tax=Streptomyces sp. ADI96-02 TaxID=1522760 RepID=UPI000F9D3691|nr:DUF6518 family protein [Streptomyces sp. ADI96-02]RPK68206.1 hypothetical protein EES43_02020 [Streptomyces sp. ADI96-02]